MTKDEFESISETVSIHLWDDFDDHKINNDPMEFLELARLGWEFKYGKGAYMLALDKLAKERENGETNP